MSKPDEDRRHDDTLRDDTLRDDTLRDDTLRDDTLRDRQQTSRQLLFEALVSEHVRQPGVSIGRALQNEGLRIHGKIFAFLRDDRLVVKLPAARVRTLMQTAGAIAFQSGGRTMKEWVCVPLPDTPAGPGLWQRLAAESKTYVDPEDKER